LTADQIGTPTGGGLVTNQEGLALLSLDENLKAVDRLTLEANLKQFTQQQFNDPWKWDISACNILQSWQGEFPKLCHIYSGTFSRTVKLLKERGCKVCYTAAAHDKEISQKEHEKWGIPFAQLYPHLCDPELWNQYLQGYLDADVVVCPSTLSANIMKGYGCQRVEIIPHGCTLPEKIEPLPSKFVCGYLGSLGADKGIPYLLQAWSQLNYKDAVLVIAGGQSASIQIMELLEIFGSSNIILTGWIKNVSDFYNSISLYIQASVSEGYGLEVLEAMAHGRMVICSDGTGAKDLLSTNFIFKSGNVDDLVKIIDEQKQLRDNNQNMLLGRANQQVAEYFTWDKIRERYCNLWRSMV